MATVSGETAERDDGSTRRKKRQRRTHSTIGVDLKARIIILGIKSRGTQPEAKQSFQAKLLLTTKFNSLNPAKRQLPV